MADSFTPHHMDQSEAESDQIATSLTVPSQPQQEFYIVTTDTPLPNAEPGIQLIIHKRSPTSIGTFELATVQNDDDDDYKDNLTVSPDQNQIDTSNPLPPDDTTNQPMLQSEPECTVIIDQEGGENGFTTFRLADLPVEPLTFVSSLILGRSQLFFKSPENKQFLLVYYADEECQFVMQKLIKPRGNPYGFVQLYWNCIFEPECTQKFHIQANYDRHLETQHYGSSFPCPVRGCIFSVLNAKWAWHNEAFHPGETTFPCSKCEIKFPTLEQLLPHSYTHVPGLFQCCSPDCLKQYDNQVKVRRHMLRHKPIECSICGIEVPTNYLNRHQKDHENEK